MADDLKNLVPYAIVYLNGTRLSVQQEASIKQIIVQERVDSPSSCSIVLSDSNREWTDSEDFSEGSEIKVSMGYKDTAEEIFCGDIIGINPQFKQQSDDVVVINAKNGLHRLCRGKKTIAYNDMTDTDIIKKIAGNAGLSDDIENIGSEHIFTIQRNMTDYDYIMLMAKKYNCKVHVKDDTLSFRKAEDAEAKDVVLEWGKTLLEFNINTDTTKLITEVEVRGWDKEKGEAIVGSAVVGDVPKPFDGSDLGGSIVKENFGDAKMVFIDDNVADQSAADALALDILTNNSMNFVTGSGTTEGNNMIHADMIMEIKEVGTRFNGKYYVNSVRHVYSSSGGYMSYFNVARNTT